MLRFIMNKTREDLAIAKEFNKAVQTIVKKAKRQGYIIHKNNINKAKPINRICGVIKASAPYSTDELLCR